MKKKDSMFRTGSSVTARGECSRVTTKIKVANTRQLDSLVLAKRCARTLPARVTSTRHKRTKNENWSGQKGVDMANGVLMSGAGHRNPTSIPFCYYARIDANPWLQGLWPLAI